jgi:hypothetical protein
LNVYDEPQGLATAPIMFWLLVSGIAIGVMTIIEWFERRK